VAADLALLRARTDEALSRVRGRGSDDEIAQARALVEELRNERQYTLLLQLAEALSRRVPDDARNRRLYAQGLIEQGMATVAIDVLKPLAARLPKNDPEQAEATGLLGRAYKQIFFDAGDKTSASAVAALKQAIAIYRKPFDDNPANTWHGVNLLALITRARGLGVKVAKDLQPDAVARKVIDALNGVPLEKRDEWHLPTLAEASLGLNEWSAVEAALKKYVADPNVPSFLIASTLRQFTQVWDIEGIDDRGRALAEILRARLLEVSSGQLTLSPEALQHARSQPDPPAGQLEAVLGQFGTKSWRWYKTGLDRAAAVCSIRAKLGTRMGTGWLVRAGSLGRTPEDELLVVTNFHVVNEQGAHNGIAPDAAEIVFEAVDEAKVYTVKEIIWSSPPARHDCTLLRLAEPVLGITPLPVAKSLPVIEKAAHVYVIGHPGGRELAFSLQDNELLDHEGPPAGKPAIDGVWRVHYRAPTEGGSSGSPVFNAAFWEVIALHHLGGKTGVPKLNGNEGSYGANEGISINSIVAAMAKGV
jgi:hypothetical protein